MEISLSITKGAGSINHNRRTFKASNVDVSRTINNIVLIDKDIKKTYNEIFGDALEKYNSKQNRNDRKIKSYYDKIKHSNQEKPFYELIVQLGNKENPYDIQQACVEVLKDFFDDMQKKYSENIIIFGAYIHLDEATPHIHIDYVPVCHNQKRGLETRNSHNLAMKELGFYKYADWREELMDNLEHIAKEHSFERMDMGNTEKHISIQKYKDVMAEVEIAEERLSEYEDMIECSEKEIQQLNEAKNYLETHSEPLYFKRLFDLLLDFIEQIILPLLPNNLADKICNMINRNTYEEIETDISNRLNSIKYENDIEQDITDF